MGKMYSIDLIFEVQPTADTIKKMVMRGKNMGIKFSYKDGSQELSLEETIQKFLNDFKHSDLYEVDYDTGVIGTYQNTIFVLHIYKKDNNFLLSFLALGYFWYKQIGDETYFDFGRYVKFLIDLCNDFPIIKIETHID